MVQNESASDGDTLFYRRWDGKTWTSPVDVLATAERDATFPQLAVTPDSILHAVWTAAGNVLYAHAPACCAENVHAWSQPIKLGSEALPNAALAADAQGRLHVLFSYRFQSNVVYVRSDDDGLTWPIYTYR
jgi:hypothetical protein